MLSAQQYLELIRDRGERRLELERVYRNIQREELFLLAYGKLYANQGAMTPGTDPADTVDGMSLKRIRQILKELEDGEYRWEPARRIYIPKANGKLRPLGIPSWKDKLLQAVMRTVLEAYYEPQFSTHSHGFRPGRGCHTTLQEIKGVWTGTKWFIEGDIKGCFDNIDHETLLAIMADKIKDNRLMKLLRQMLKAGYLEDWKYHRTHSGTPQGGVISPLLANIYLNELDQFIEIELMPKYNRGIKRALNPPYQEAATQRLMATRKGDREQAEAYLEVMHTLPSGDPNDPNYRRLRYVRYADDFILGFVGPKAEAEEIKQAIGQFLKERLKLDMEEDKTLITHTTSKPAKFLSYHIQVARNNTHQKNGRRETNGKIQLRVPPEVRRKWIAKYSREGKPVHRIELTIQGDFDTVQQYGAELRGIVNYYRLAVNVARLYSLKHVMMVSLVATLANKHKTGTRTIYSKYRTVFETGMQGIQVVIQREGKPPLTAKFGEQPIRYQRMVEHLEDTRYQPKTKRVQLLDRLLAQVCELCGSTENIEVHHIRKLADTRKKYRHKEKPLWVEKMMAMRRKTLVVCRSCHQNITYGRYDGPAISSRRAG